VRIVFGIFIKEKRGGNYEGSCQREKKVGII